MPTGRNLSCDGLQRRNSFKFCIFCIPDIAFGRQIFFIGGYFVFGLFRSYLSVFVQYHARVRIAFTVPPTAFEPEPAVDSAVIVIAPYDLDDRLEPEDEDGLWRLVQAAFRERRKMIHNVLARQLPVDGTRVSAALAACSIDPDRRPQTLAVGEWLALREALGPIGTDRRGRSPDA